jgi:hypothetical protein
MPACEPQEPASSLVAGVSESTVSSRLAASRRNGCERCAYQPQQRVLPAASSLSRGPVADAPDRRVASELPVCRQPDAARSAQPSRSGGGPPSHPHADEEDVYRGHLAPAEHVETSARTQDLSLSAARVGHHAAQPGLGDRHQRAMTARRKRGCRSKTLCLLAFDRLL